MIIRPKWARGLTLLETLLTMTMLGLLLGLVFHFFRWGSAQFQTTSLQGTLQAEALQISHKLAADLERSAPESVSLETGPGRELTLDGQVFKRHAVCFSTLADWRSPTSYEPSTGLALWDRYLIYYSDLQEQGGFYRLFIDPGGSAVGPYADFPGAFLMTPPPNSLGEVVGASTLSRSVRTFELSQLSPGTYSCTLLLQKTSPLKEQSGRPATRNAEVLLTVRPKNLLP